MPLTRWYDGVPVTFSDEEVKRLEAVFTNPGRVKYDSNNKTSCPYDRILLDIQKYVDLTPGRIR